MMDTSSHWITLLEKNGCRITSPRRAIIEILASSQRALEPTEIYDLARAVQPGLGLVTVYRTLERLESLGLIQRVHREDGCHMVMKAANGHQHYLICNGCGKTIVFQGDDLSALFSRVEDRTGYKVSEHWLQLFGLCEKCKTEQDKSA